MSMIMCVYHCEVPVDTFPCIQCVFILVGWHAISQSGDKSCRMLNVDLRYVVIMHTSLHTLYIIVS